MVYLFLENISQFMCVLYSVMLLKIYTTTYLSKNLSVISFNKMVIVNFTVNLTQFIQYNFYRKLRRIPNPNAIQL